MLALSLLLACTSPGASADKSYYRWLDDRGNPVHSDRPPPAGTPYEVISAGSSLKRVVTPDEGAVPPEVKPRVGNEFEQVDTKAKEEQFEKNPELCELARSNLSTLNSAARVRLRDENGELVFLSDEQKAAEVAKAEQMIDVHCP
nr:DUF4124 domain-containing protein [Parahaliea mediterranea]